jgi:hypothetical protein
MKYFICPHRGEIAIVESMFSQILKIKAHLHTPRTELILIKACKNTNICDHVNLTHAISGFPVVQTTSSCKVIDMKAFNPQLVA